MKSKFLPLIFAFMTLFTFSAIPAFSGTTINFDDVDPGTLSNGQPIEIGVITNGYQGFNWSNFYTDDAPIHARMSGTNGGYYGMVTASNVAFNSGGTPAEIDAIATSFNFSSAYLTGVWNSNLDIQVQGFNGSTLLYDTTVVASATTPILFTFNYLDIDRLTFNSFGGQNAGFPNGGGQQFVMDDFTVEFVPEPSSLLLVTAGALLLCPLLKRKQA